MVAGGTAHNYYGMKIIENRKYWLIFSGIMFALGITALSIWGLRLGPDFTGGSQLEVRIADKPTLADVQATTMDVRKDVSVQELNNSFILKSSTLTEVEHEQLFDALKKKFPAAEEVRFDSIGPVIGQEIKSKSIMAIVLVTAMVLCYIAWSFRKVAGPVSPWVYGAIVVFTFVHDIIIPLGIIAVYTHFSGIELTSAFIAAILTILGYSINDTIVVFDRVRENVRRLRGTFEEVVESSVRQSVSRSINTSVTTLLALVSIYFFGGESLHIFALTLILGIIFGAYSSIFIASPMLVVWYNWKRKH